MSGRHVHLRFFTPEPAKFLGRPCFLCRVEVDEAIGMPREIFAFQRTPIDTAAGEFQDEFSFVCSPYDLSVYPVGEPHPDMSPAYFRKAEISILLPSVSAYDKFAEEIKNQVAALIHMMNKLDDLVVQSEAWIPGPPESSSSSSFSG